MSSSWSEKYRPTTTKNVVGNKIQIKSIANWLDSYDKNKIAQMTSPKRRKRLNIKIQTDDDVLDEENDLPIDLTDDVQNAPMSKIHNSDDHSCLIVLGDHGIGKTCSVLAILADKQYVPQMINLSKIGQMKNIDDYVEKLIRGVHFLNHFGKAEEKSAIIIDEIESITSQIEKNFVFTLLKLNEKNWHIPIIFIANNKHNKVTSTLKANSKVVYFQQPSNDQMKTLLLTICAKEHMCLENEELANKIILHSQKDFRRLLFILQDLQTNYNHNISNAEFDEYCIFSKKKDSDIDIFKASASMITKFQNIDECIRLYEGEKVIIPLMMHQNFVKCINKFYPYKTKAINLAYEIAISMAKGDLIENYIYSDQNWDMQEVHGFFTCVRPSYELSTAMPNVLEEGVKIMLDFPHDLNRTSIKKINRKNVINSNECLRNFDIKDFIYANKLIKLMIEDNCVDECATIFKGYNMFIDNVESILKIDKINETKTTMQTQVKKRFNLTLGIKKKSKSKKTKNKT